MAGAALQAGHEVDVFECLFAQDLELELAAKVTEFQPEVCGVSIRLVNGKVVGSANDPWSIQSFDVRPKVREVVTCIQRSAPLADIILGGPGFNYYGPNWLQYLDLDYGLRGEAEFTFPLYLDMLENGGDIHQIAGCIYRHNGEWGEVERAYRRTDMLERRRNLMEGWTRFILRNSTDAVIDLNALDAGGRTTYS